MAEKDSSAAFGELLTRLIADSEEALMARILHYAKARDYARYTSTLQEAWRLSISGLSASLVNALDRTDEELELGPGIDFTQDPVAAFGIRAAHRHRERGVDLGMFLGLMKYYRQAYDDTIRASDLPPDAKSWAEHRVCRFFDRMEIGFCVTWAGEGVSDGLQALQSANRRMTNEKNKYLTFFESMPQPAFLVDRTGAVENMNQAAARLFSEASGPGAHYYRKRLEFDDENAAPDEKVSVARLLPWLGNSFDNFMAGPEQNHQETREVPSTSGLRHVYLRFSKMLDVSGKFTGAVIIAEDFTDRALAEVGLRTSESALRAIFNSSYDALCIFDFDGTVKKVNDSMLKMFQIDPEKAVGVRFREELSGEENPSADLDSIWARAVSGETQIFEWRAKRFRDKTLFDAEIVLQKMALSDGEVILASVRDITERKAAEDERLKREKLEGTLELAGAVCHELNQPIMAVSGYSELTMMSLDPNHDLYGKIKKINEQVLRMGEITRKLMKITRYRSKRYSKGEKIIDIEGSSHET